MISEICLYYWFTTLCLLIIVLFQFQTGIAGSRLDGKGIMLGKDGGVSVGVEGSVGVDVGTDGVLGVVVDVAAQDVYGGGQVDVGVMVGVTVGVVSVGAYSVGGAQTSSLAAQNPL